jgi:hypothetical protein
MDEDMADPRRFPDAEGAPEQRYVDEDLAQGKTTRGSEGA